MYLNTVGQKAIKYILLTTDTCAKKDVRHYALLTDFMDI